MRIKTSHRGPRIKIGGLFLHLLLTAPQTVNQALEAAPPGWASGLFSREFRYKHDLD